MQEPAFQTMGFKSCFEKEEQHCMNITSFGIVSTDNRQ